MRAHLRRNRTALPAHVARVIGPSPARAEPHDAAAWLPVPDPHGLPSIATLLEEATPVVDFSDEEIDLVALEAMVSPSPARAEPHDAAAWLPLPDDVHELPSVHALLDPHPEVQAAVVAEAEAVIADALAAAEASSAPSPARAEPHDAAAWLPLPCVDELAAVAELRDVGATPPGTRRRTAIRRFPARLVFIVLLVTATVGAGGWAGSQILAPGGSQVSLVVDGTRQEMRTNFKTVGALLAAEHVHLAADDAVVPPAATALRDGLHVDVLRAFAVTVDIDGTTRTVRTVEHSAEGLATQLELGKLTAVRNAPGRLGAGSTVVYRTRTSGSLKIDNQAVTFDSPSHTVDELLQSYNVNLVGDDYVVPARDTVLVDGTSVTVVRVGDAVTQQTRKIPFDTVQRADPSLAIGETRELQAGKAGTLVVTYRQRVENGTKGDRTLLSEVPSVEPVPRVMGYGTQADPHWDELARCESGGRWETVDAAPNGYDGGLGIYRGTWRAYGGTEFAPNAGLATREQQIIVGMRIYDDLGWDPWGCANNVLHWPNRT